MRCYKAFDIDTVLSQRLRFPLCVGSNHIFLGVLGTLKLWVPIETTMPDKEYIVSVVGPGDPIDHIPSYAVSAFTPWKWVFRGEPRAEDGRACVKWGVIAYLYEANETALGLHP